MRIGNLLKFLLVLLILIALALTITFYVVSRRPFPTTDGEIQVAGLQSEVRILRDELGIPHIYADNEHDLAFAQGYVHAQDRFWQMEFWRHIGLGRLSEIVGSATLDTDLFIRNIGWNRIAEETTAYYRDNEPEVWAMLEAYSAGVNAYLSENRDSMSFNQTVLGLSTGEWVVEDWEPLHTIAWGTVMAWDLRGSNNVNSEMARADLITALGEDVMAQLSPSYPDNRPVIFPSNAGGHHQSLAEFVAAWEQVNRQQVGTQPENGFALGRGDAVGSNNWVVSGEHTATGMPMLANDPHLGVQLPSIWYLVGLHSPELDVAGFSFAGAPGVVIGHNRDIAWGVTNLSADSQDLFIEKVNPDNPHQYEFEGEWLDMTVFEEEIKVNGAESVMLTVRATHHGPLLNNIDEELTDSLAVRWTAFEPSRLLKAVYLLNRAANYEEFHEALSYWDTAAQNVVYADREGNIAYQATGRYPIREGWDGTLPIAGWTGEFEWDHWIPYAEMPVILNPDEGFIVTANNAVVDDGFPYTLTTRWASGDRAQRLVDLLADATANGNVTIDTMTAIQNDNYELLRDSYQPLFDGLRSDDAQVQSALDLLRGWDGSLEVDSVSGALFEVFLMQLANGIWADELGDNADDLINNGSTMRILLHQMADDPDNDFWDDTTTGAREANGDIILTAVENTVAWFNDNVGGDINDWSWGSIHTITFRSDPLGQSGIAPLERIVNRGPFPVDGGSGIVNANGFSWGNIAEVRGNPSMRMVVDLSNFDQSVAIHPTGQSGHPYHAHYDDMIELWLAGEYADFVYSISAVEDTAAETLILQPER